MVFSFLFYFSSVILLSSNCSTVAENRSSPADARTCEFHYLTSDESGSYYMLQCDFQQVVGTLKKNYYIVHYDRSLKQDASVDCGIPPEEFFHYKSKLEWGGTVYVFMDHFETGITEMKNQRTTIFKLDRGSKKLMRVKNSVNDFSSDLNSNFETYDNYDTSADGQLLALVSCDLKYKEGPTACQYIVLDKDLKVINKGIGTSKTEFDYANFVMRAGSQVSVSDKGIVSIIIEPFIVSGDKGFDKQRIHHLTLNAQSGCIDKALESAKGDLTRSLYFRGDDNQEYLVSAVSNPGTFNLIGLQFDEIRDGELTQNTKYVSIAPEKLVDKLNEKTRANILKDFTKNSGYVHYKFSLSTCEINHGKIYVTIARYSEDNKGVQYTGSTVIMQLNTDFSIQWTSVLPQSYYNSQVFTSDGLCFFNDDSYPADFKLDEAVEKTAAGSQFGIPDHIPTVIFCNSAGRLSVKSAIPPNEEGLSVHTHFVPDSFGCSRFDNKVFGFISFPKQPDTRMYAWGH